MKHRPDGPNGPPQTSEVPKILFINGDGSTDCKPFPTDASARRYARAKGYRFAYRDGIRIYPLASAYTQDKDGTFVRHTDVNEDC